MLSALTVLIILSRHYAAQTHFLLLICMKSEMFKKSIVAVSVALAISGVAQARQSIDYIQVDNGSNFYGQAINDRNIDRVSFNKVEALTRDQIDTIKKRHADLDKAIADIHATNGALNENMESLLTMADDRLDRSEDNFKQLDSYLKGANARLDDVSARHDKLVSDLKNADWSSVGGKTLSQNQIDAIKKRHVDLDKAIADIHATNGALNENMESLLTMADDRLDRSEDNFNQLDSYLKGANARLDDVSARHDKLVSDLKNADWSSVGGKTLSQNQIDAIKKRHADLDKAIADIHATNGALNENMESLLTMADDRLDRSEDNFKQLDSYLRGANVRLDDVSARHDNLVSDLKNADWSAVGGKGLSQEQVESIQKRHADLDKTIADIHATNGALNDNMESLLTMADDRLDRSEDNFKKLDGYLKEANAQLEKKFDELEGVEHPQPEVGKKELIQSMDIMNAQFEAQMKKMHEHYSDQMAEMQARIDELKQPSSPVIDAEAINKQYQADLKRMATDLAQKIHADYQAKIDALNDKVDNGQPPSNAHVDREQVKAQYEADLKAVYEAAVATVNNNVSNGLSAEEKVAMQDWSNKIDGEVSSLKYGLESLEQDIDTLNDGVSMAMAMSAMPQATGAGSSMVSAGLGAFNGSEAVAVGVSYRAHDLPVTINLNFSATENDTGAAVGIGYQF